MNGVFEALAGRTVLPRLSAEGELALSSMFPQTFSARILAAEAVGVWVLTSSKDANRQYDQAMLLKWQYFATAAFDFKPQPAAARTRIGFK